MCLAHQKANFISLRKAQFHDKVISYCGSNISFLTIMMKENKLVDLSIEFSLNIINSLCDIKGHSSLVNQLERSATSIGANIHEANYAHSKPDFIAKLQIALKECYESEYWLILFEKTNLIDEATIKNLKNMCGTIRRLLISSITTAKSSL